MNLLNNLRKTLAERLAHYRKVHGWTQHDLATAANMSASGLRGYEQQTRWPDPEELARLAKALGIESEDLLIVKPVPKENAVNFAVSAIAAASHLGPDITGRFAALNDSEIDMDALRAEILGILDAYLRPAASSHDRGRVSANPGHTSKRLK